MTTPIDPNEVRLVGENSFIRLLDKKGGKEITRASHWRILYSPEGPGHALFLTSSNLTDGDVRIYSDNMAMARWLQEDLESMFLPAFADKNIPVFDAQFDKYGNAFSSWTESVESAADAIVLTWSGLAPESLMVRAGPNERPNRPLGMYSCFTPAKEGQVELNGRFADGKAYPDKLGDSPSSTACLAWGESWTRPR
ncbi:MAG: hypothetical protein O2854_08010 [Chloroflexi bacterium]|nr:hypothetical protein [Chloroflexota bacterium]